ncbi:MAG: SufE family protein [Parachlamydiales bacterium]
MFASIQQKELRVRALFKGLTTPEEKYKKIIEFGQELPPMSLQEEAHLVPGCQSRVYLAPHVEGRLLYLSAASDALISAGLAHLLVAVYSGETPEAILRTPPTFFKELGILSSLSPGRANGLASMWRRIQELALSTVSR